MEKINNREWKSLLKQFTLEEECFVVTDSESKTSIVEKCHPINKFRGNHYFLVNAINTHLGIRVERGKKNIIIHKSLLNKVGCISYCPFQYSDIKTYKEKSKEYTKEKRQKLNLIIEERMKNPAYAKKVEQNKRREEWIDKTKEENLCKSTHAERFLYRNALKRYGNRVKAQYEITVNDHIYFLDFYIRAMHVAIEVDGGYHGSIEQSAKDRERDANLASIGIKTIRIKNEQVYCKPCRDELIAALEKRKHFNRETADNSVDTLYIGLND